MNASNKLIINDVKLIQNQTNSKMESIVMILTDKLNLSDKHPNIVRQNINLLEFPIWAIDTKDKDYKYEVDTEFGKYTLICNRDVGIPEYIDILVYYYISYLSQQHNTRIIHLTVYDICKNLKLPLNGYYYQRVKDSLDIWENCTAKFEGNFFIGNREYTRIGIKFFTYHTFKSVEYKGKRRKSKTYEVVLSEELFNESKTLFRSIEFDLLIELKRPLAVRIFEYLDKQFIEREEIKRNVEKLFQKLRMALRKYPSLIKRQLSSIASAIKLINKYLIKYRKTFCYEFEYYQNSQGEFICIFRKVHNAEEIEYIDLPTKKSLPAQQQGQTRNKIAIQNQGTLKNKLKKIGVHWRTTEKILREHTPETIQKAITDFEFVYTEKLKKGEKIGKTGGYFCSMLPQKGEEYEYSYEYKKHIKEQEAKKNSEETNQSNQEQSIDQDLLDQVLHYGVGKKLAIKHVQEDPQKVRDALECIAEKIKKGEQLDNIAGFYKYAYDNSLGYKSPYERKKEEIEEAKKKARQTIEKNERTIEWIKDKHKVFMKVESNKILKGLSQEEKQHIHNECLKELQEDSINLKRYKELETTRFLYRRFKVQDIYLSKEKELAYFAKTKGFNIKQLEMEIEEAKEIQRKYR